MSETPPTPLEALRQRFPNLKPIKGPPGLVTFNGIGTGMYGKRAYDAETGTYIKTRCFCFIFLPLLALDAYRVADAETGGWYFLGKERLSKFARTWNWWTFTVMLALVAAGSWNVYTSNPQYRARQELKQAAELLAGGEPLKAASTYRKVAQNRHLFGEARAGLKNAVEEMLRSSSPAVIESAFHLLANLPANLNKPAPLVPDAVERGLGFVAKFRDSHPEPALGILRQVMLLGDKIQNLRPLQIDLLREIIARSPGNINRIIELALIYESENQFKECIELLLPHREKLGSTEGARILGQGALREGDYDGAYHLLQPYVAARLQQLHAVEQAYTTTLNRAYASAIEFLQAGKADKSFYDRYERSSKPDQEALVNAFIEKRLQADQIYQRVLRELRAANAIVNVTLDLGVVQLNRAQDLSDPAARTAELEAAEKTFLAIRGLAGDTDEYKLFLGQVYYWLGKSAEGKELFDQLLESSQRAHPVLLSLANTLRDVGETSRARELSEEAYNGSTDDQQKHAAARFRSLVATDLDDEIAWLDKADVNQVGTAISLNNARGKKALQDGDKTAAAEFLRKAIDGYRNLPKSTATLNNAGLACLSLYEITRDLRDHDRALALIEEAVSLAPGDSILMINCTDVLLRRAVIELLRDSIRVDLVGEVGMGALAHLYHDEPGRAALQQKLRENETFKKASGYLDRAMLLAPKSTTLYETALQLQSGFRDAAELQKIKQRLKTANPDFAEAKSQALEFYRGTKDADYAKRLRASIQKYEELARLPEIAGHTLTSEFVGVTLGTLRQNLYIYGESVDTQQLLKDAISLHQRRDSASTHGHLRNAYFFVAHEELMRSHRDYATLANHVRRSLSPRYLICFVLERGGPLAQAAKANPNVTRALALEKESNRRFPLFCGADDWAMFRSIDTAEADRIAIHLKLDQITRDIEELEQQIHPYSAAKILDAYWTCKLFGDETKATAIYQQAVTAGVPLPSLAR